MNDKNAESLDSTSLSSKQINPVTAGTEGYSTSGLVRSTIAKLEAERRLNDLGAKWSRFSGYDSIEELKRAVLELEIRLNKARSNLDESKRAYVDSVGLRSNSQRQINDLLSRKSSWSENDLSQYTTLLRSEHSQNRSETDSQARYEQAEQELQSAFDELVRAVMRRYHEEQIWSDKVRNASSYASIIVAGLNILIFTIAIIFVEPYKRRKLAETFEKRLLEGEAQSRALIQATIEDFDARTAQAQEALTNEVRQGYQQVLQGLGAAVPAPVLSDGQLAAPTLPLAARLRIGLADENRRSEWAVTSGLGALAGIALTLAFTLLAGGAPPAAP
ncbi:unnamed protein product [Tilletia controversa]|nr:unnamed protein product [Tilletia controversa]CAD6946696.1 unnamed protein product [Tilletia caries]CAD6986346.1 unnamed protein product [Tilletia controversa]